MCQNEELLGALVMGVVGPVFSCGGGCVGKGWGRIAFGFQSNFNEARYFLGEDALLARACSRQNQTRAFDVIDSFKLSGI